MQIQRKNKNKAKITIITLIVALFIVAGAAYLYISSQSKSESASTENDKDTVDSRNNNTKPTSDPNQESYTDGKPVADGIKDDRSRDDGSDNLKASITSVTQDGDTLRIRTLVEGVTSNGSCTLTATGSDSKVITKAAAIQPLSSSSTCAGFDISTKELSPGNLNVEIKILSNNKSAQLNKVVTIQ